MIPRMYRRDQEDKLHTIARCFFEAEHGWISLALERLADLTDEFPDDPQVDYAEGMIRRDFLGQGIAAEDLFLRAQQHATDRTHSNENYLFSTFNAAKFARNQAEYRRQERIARTLAPNDPDLRLFDHINEALADGVEYSELLAHAVGQHQQAGEHGSCAAFAELALGAGDFSRQDQLRLRKARAGSLRELDKSCEASRSARGEAFPPEERLALIEALNEIDGVLAIDPADHVSWNFRSAWLNLLDRHEEALESAAKALEFCPSGYLRPKTNRIYALSHLGRNDEARQLVDQVIDEARKVGPPAAQDAAMAQQYKIELNTPMPTDDEILTALSKKVLQSAVLTAGQVGDQWRSGDGEAEIAKGLHSRLLQAGPVWNLAHAALVAEFLQYFCPEIVWKSLMQASERDFEGFTNIVFGIYFVASHAQGVTRRDACRCVLLLLLGAGNPDKIRADYREAVKGMSVGPGQYSHLEEYIRTEMARSYPVLLRLLPDTPGLTEEETEYARSVTLHRFKAASGTVREAAARRGAGCLWFLLLVVFWILYLLHRSGKLW